MKKKETGEKKSASDSSTEKLQQELSYLLNKGVKFTIPAERFQKKRFWKKPEKVTVNITYDIQQPTLAVLDLINYYLTGIDIDEQAIAGSDNPYPELRKISRDNMYRICQAVAAACLGRRCFVFFGSDYKTDHKAVDKTAIELMNTITPHRLMEMAQAISVMCNLSDFLNSIRLLRIAPDRIEPVKED